jgi:hypothetical protein
MDNMRFIDWIDLGALVIYIIFNIVIFAVRGKKK